MEEHDAFRRVADEVTYDLYDHYATLSVYLRLNGLVPPTAQKTP